MKNFIVVEVGSTVTKTYQYLDGQIIALPSKTILFKPHFKDGKLNSEDVKSLTSHICALKEKTSKIFVYGTSIFRKLDKTESTLFFKTFKEATGLKFNVVTAEQEALYTVSGVTLGNDYKGRLAVMICGGGSIEVMVIENKKVIEKHFNNFGVVDIREKFKNINDFKPHISTKEIIAYCEANIANIENKCDILVTAGGDTKYCQETIAWEFLKPNKFYDDPLQPHMIKIEDYNKANKKFVTKQDISVFKKFTVYQDDWWDFSRGYNCCISAIAKKVGAKYEIPSRINMCIGIINELKSK